MFHCLVSKILSNKHLIPLILLTLFSLSLSNINATEKNEKIKIVTTFTVISDITKNITGDAAIVNSITKPGAEIHNYQPTPRDIIKAQEADLLIYNGMGLELWFEQFYDNLDDIPSVLATEGIEPMGITIGPYNGKPNPHAWMAIDSAKFYIDNIMESLIKHDPKNKEIYIENAENYFNKIQDTLAPFTTKVNNIDKKDRWLVTSEGAFSYLARDLGLNELFIWPINADQQGSPKQVKNVIDTINENGIKVIFSESTISPKPAQQIARETNIKYGGILYVDSLTDLDGPVPTYLDLLSATYLTVIKGITNK
ncbi:MAG: metal ABC transporter substrate-binding protein [Hyphomicrobiales bacterium]|nr:metal ABC transporter substrate-binding protein [Hyphomicrobiales bacterium]